MRRTAICFWMTCARSSAASATYGLFNSLAQTLLKITESRRSGHLSGDRAVGLQPGRSRQSPAGGLSLPPQDAWRVKGFRRQSRGVRTKPHSNQRGRPNQAVRSFAPLQARRERPELFSTGEYLALESAGPFEQHLFGFVRQTHEHVAVVVVPRLMTRLTPDLTQAPLGTQYGRTRVCYCQPSIRPCAGATFSQTNV